MRTILFVLFVCFLQSVNATTYYFSSVSGDDSRTSSEARNSSTPWKSLSKLNAVFSSLQPGDAVLLKRDETFYGSIIVNKSGTSGSPITIGAYGSGDKPIITSLVTLTNWVSKGNGIYESYNSSLDATVNNVLLNGIPQELGRFPNSDASNKGYLMYEAVSGKTSITDNELKSTPNWTGADVVIRPRRWVTDRNLITSHSGTNISYKATSSYTPYNKQGYFIENSIKTLDKFGEWYYNPSTKKVSIYFGSNSPSAYSAMASTNGNLITCYKFSNVIFDNLVIKGANGSGFDIRYGTNLYISSCDIMNSGQYGIMAKYATNFRVENCTVSYSNFGGINLGYAGDNAIIRNNKITNTSIFAGMGSSGDSKGIGIFTFGNNSIIEYNQIINTGYNAISFNGDYVTIKNNFIDNFCMTKDDGAGIYTYTGNINTPGKGRKLIGNVIINGRGAWEGTSLPVFYMANGIFLDNGTSGVELTDNTIANCATQGFFLQSAHEVTIKSNTVFNSSFRQLSIIDLPNHPNVRNCSITNNIFFANVTTLRPQRVIYLESREGNIDDFGKFSGNYYQRPYESNKTYFDLDNSKVERVEPTAKLVTYVNPVRFEYNATKEAKTISLDATYTDVKNNKYSGSVTLQPFTSVILIKSSGGSDNTGTSPVVSITSPAPNATFNTGANINIKATATDGDGSVSKVEFFNGTTLLSTQQSSPYEYSWQNVSAGNYTITARATDNSGHTTSKSVSVSVTSSSLSYPKVSITSPTSNASFRAGSTITISANASDAGGSIKTVVFYKGTTVLNTQKYAPYIWYWRNVGEGSYTITAKATDNNGHVTTSASVNIKVVKASSRSSDNNGSVDVVGKSNIADSNSAINNKADNSSFDFRLFPNPAASTIKVNFDNVQINQKANLSVQSVSGSILKSQSVNLLGKTVEIDISSLPPGIYIMRLSGSNFGINKKFVKIN